MLPGWSFHNEPLISQLSLLTNQEDTSVPDRRVSIGTFIRTDAPRGNVRGSLRRFEGRYSLDVTFYLVL